jgi:magnesium-transporting ATPase (P-type)
MEQFRRVANIYFLIIGFIMAIGYFTNLFESAVSPWTTLGPLALVISVSLLQEGLADLGRHRSDSATNNYPCVVLRRADELDEEGGKRDLTVMEGNDLEVNLEKSYFMANSIQDPSNHTTGGRSCKVAFESIKRMDIRQGHLVLIRDRDMVPADVILLASSSDNGNAYIETSSIDGETNLKLRTSPHLPKKVLRHSRAQSVRDLGADDDDEDKQVLRESLQKATKRVCRFSALGFPRGRSAMENPSNPTNVNDIDENVRPSSSSSTGLRMMGRSISVAKFATQGIGDGIEAVRDVMSPRRGSLRASQDALPEVEIKYVATLKSEPPNASVNTFTGVLLLPPVQFGGPSVEIPLNADNILLRGAVLRNTEWAIGLACFTGKDTKLVRNSFDTPSKMSRFDLLTNNMVLCTLGVMAILISYLASLASVTNNQKFDSLW